MPARTSSPAVTPLAAEADDPFRDLSRSEFAYGRMRDAIQAGVYAPGNRVREDDVARFLGISRTPVREALRLLQAHGLLELGPGRGLVVVELTKQQIIELYNMRELLEGSAARLAARHSSPGEIDALRHALELFAQSTHDPRRAAAANRTLHDAIYGAAHNRYLVQSLDRLADALALLPRTTYEVPGRAEAAISEHRAIIDAIAAHDPDLAEAAAREHIREAQRHRMRMLFSV